MRRVTILGIGLLCLLFSVTAQAQPAHCESLLSGGVFNRTKTYTARQNLERLQYVFCSDEAATEERARSWAAQLGVNIKIIGINLGGGSSAQSYTEWRKHLCQTQDSQRYQNELLAADVTTASREILDTFNNCINSQNGLVQYAEATPKSNEFIWHLIYKPTTPKIVQVSVQLKASSEITCDEKAKLPSSITVGPNGTTLLCKRDICTPAVLIVNSDSKPFPPTLTLNSEEPPPPPSAPPPSVLGPYKQEMKAPIQIPLPLGQTCVVQKKGTWYAHCPNQNAPSDCVDLKIENGQAFSGHFDTNQYGDNCGVCYYTFTCTPPTPADPWKDHACRVNKKPTLSKH